MNILSRILGRKAPKYGAVYSSGMPISSLQPSQTGTIDCAGVQYLVGSGNSLSQYWPASVLTEDDVRRIVRAEIANATIWTDQVRYS